MKNLYALLILVAALLVMQPGAAAAQEISTDALVEATAPADTYIFVRDDCSHCQDMKAFIAAEPSLTTGYDIAFIDIATEDGKALFDHVTQTLATGKVTPITLVDGQVYVGFAPDVTGAALLEHAAEEQQTSRTLTDYLAAEATIAGSTATCPEDGSVPCAVPEQQELRIPVLGTINPQTTSLSFIAIALGFVDGFNPCAMWVLLTFLLILSQVGSKKKMIYLAGLFIIAEGIMYFLILNIWYQAWDFVALDRFVTPLVGLLALGSGAFFLYKYWTTRNAPLTCDITSTEHQQKTQSKIQDLVTRPITLMSSLAIIGLAFSVNVIEFACSIGIPQAFTKVLELNNLSFLGYQGYTALYTLFYMADDLIVFGLAIWGYQKFYAVGQKYSKISTGIAGILMLLLGAALVFFPDILTF